MKILTRSHADWRATLNVVATGSGRYGWEVEVHDPQAKPVDHTLTSPTDFTSSTNAAVDGLRAMDGIAGDNGMEHTNPPTGGGGQGGRTH